MFDKMFQDALNHALILPAYIERQNAADPGNKKRIYKTKIRCWWQDKLCIDCRPWFHNLRCGNIADCCEIHQNIAYREEVDIFIDQHLGYCYEIDVFIDQTLLIATRLTYSLTKAWLMRD